MGLFPLRDVWKGSHHNKTGPERSETNFSIFDKVPALASKYIVAYNANNALIVKCKCCDLKIAVFLMAPLLSWNKKFSFIAWNVYTCVFAVTPFILSIVALSRLAPTCRALLLDPCHSQRADLSWELHWAGDESPKHQPKASPSSNNVEEKGYLQERQDVCTVNDFVNFFFLVLPSFFSGFSIVRFRMH